MGWNGFHGPSESDAGSGSAGSPSQNPKDLRRFRDVRGDRTLHWWFLRFLLNCLGAFLRRCQVRLFQNPQCGCYLQYLQTQHVQTCPKTLPVFLKTYIAILFYPRLYCWDAPYLPLSVGVRGLWPASHHPFSEQLRMVLKSKKNSMYLPKHTKTTFNSLTNHFRTAIASQVAARLCSSRQ